MTSPNLRVRTSMFGTLPVPCRLSAESLRTLSRRVRTELARAPSSARAARAAERSERPARAAARLERGPEILERSERAAEDRVAAGRDPHAIVRRAAHLDEELLRRAGVCLRGIVGAHVLGDGREGRCRGIGCESREDTPPAELRV